MPRGYLKKNKNVNQKIARGGSSYAVRNAKSKSKNIKNARKRQQRKKDKRQRHEKLEDFNVSSYGREKRDFICNFRNLKNSKLQLGENGCPELTNHGLGSNILALSQIVRGGDVKSLCNTILSSSKSSANEISDLIVLLFVTRNPRGGKGEKDLSYQMFLQLWKHYPDTAIRLLELFPHFGYWKDLLLLIEKASKSDPDILQPLLKESIKIMKAQFQKDINAMNQYKNEMDLATAEITTELKKRGPKISLLAKWLPRERKYFDKKFNFVYHFTANEDSTKEWMSKSKAEYRKTVVTLTTFLELPEVLLSAQRADEINFHKIASKATFNLSKALLNETDHGKQRSKDPKRIKLAKLFINHLLKKGVKGSQLMPHEIVQEIQKGQVSPMREKVLDAQWKSLWKNVLDQVHAKAKEEGIKFDPTRMVPLSDVSGSMCGIPMVVSIALGIGISEITHSAFRDMVMTFESTPRWHKLNAGDSIVKKVQSLARAPWGGSTNFEGAYNLILDVCLQHRLKREDVPTLIVFSDMQFNQACGHYSYRGKSRGCSLVTMHNTITSKFAKTADKLGWDNSEPTPIVYWNLRNTSGHPVEKGAEGAVLLSGFSPSLLKMVMNGEALKEGEVEIVEVDGIVRKKKIRITPEEVLRKMIDDSLYDPVREILSCSKEGVLRDYEYSTPPVSSPSSPNNGSSKFT